MEGKGDSCLDDSVAFSLAEAERIARRLEMAVAAGEPGAAELVSTLASSLSETDRLVYGLYGTGLPKTLFDELRRIAANPDPDSVRRLVERLRELALKLCMQS